MTVAQAERLYKFLPKEIQAVDVTVNLTKRPHMAMTLRSAKLIIIILSIFYIPAILAGGLFLIPIYLFFIWFTFPTIQGVMAWNQDKPIIEVYLNNTKTAPMSAFTFFHEFRHLWQYSYLGNTKLETLHNKRHKGFGHNSQVLEQDANLFAKNMLTTHKEEIEDILGETIDVEKITSKFGIDPNFEPLS